MSPRPQGAKSPNLEESVSRRGVRNGHPRDPGDLVKQSTLLCAQLGSRLEELRNDLGSLREKLDAVPKLEDIKFQFMMTDLSIGLTFVFGAITTRSPASRGGTSEMLVALTI